MAEPKKDVFTDRHLWPALEVFKILDTNNWVLHNDKIRNSLVEPNTEFVFYEYGGGIGKLYVKNGVVTFEGKFDESAREFLRTVNLGRKEQLQTAKKEATRAAIETCIEVIDEWSENPYALVTDLVTRLKQL